MLRSLLPLRYLALLLGVGVSAYGEGPNFATGIKVGEVTPTSAIVWIRLTRNPHHAPSTGPMPQVAYRYPDGAELQQPKQQDDVYTVLVRYPSESDVDSIAGAAPGVAGEVRVRYRAGAGGAWTETSWLPVDVERDFTRQVVLSKLQPDTAYQIAVDSRDPSAHAGQSIEGGFRTAPAGDSVRPVLFTVITGQEYSDQDAPEGGFKVYDAMLKLSPSFFVNTGDIVYYDKLAKDTALARWHWARTYSLPTNLNFHRHVASYFMKDDHDTWQNDCWPTMTNPYMGELTFAQGQAIFLEQVPMSERTFRTFRWGKDLQIWLVEGRDFRSPNSAPDGPDKTIWGAEQKTWFKATVGESDSTFRVLISPTPLVGPDRSAKNDNHANVGFAHEGGELRRFIGEQKNMVVVCGDRHWQYVSVDAETGVREYCSGPASDAHAGGWKPNDRRPEHRYVNVVGGFLAVDVERIGDRPVMTMRHYGVDGAILNEDRVEAKR